MKLLYYKIIIFFFFPFFIFAQNTKGSIEFPECKLITEIQKKEICNDEGLKNFFAKNFSYPQVAIKNNYQGKTIIKYSITDKGELDFKLIDEKQVDPSLNEEVLKTMQKLKNSIHSGKIKLVPAVVEGKAVTTHYLFPVFLQLPPRKNPQTEGKKIIMATYRTSEKTVQFRRDIDGDIYAYLLHPKEEKLLIKITGKASPNLLTEEEQFYFYLYNLTFLKPEILLTFGQLEGKEYEIYIDKESGEENSQLQINVYLAENHSVVDTFADIDYLFQSKYAPLLFR